MGGWRGKQLGSELRDRLVDQSSPGREGGMAREQEVVQWCYVNPG